MERFFINLVLIRVLYADALVAEPRLALGWLAPLGRLIGDPRLSMTGIFLSLSRVLPDRYPLDDDLSSYVNAEHRLGHLLDVGIIVPRLGELYDWSASELGLLALNALLAHCGPTPAYAWSPQEADVWPPNRHVSLEPRGGRSPYLRGSCEWVELSNQVTTFGSWSRSLEFVSHPYAMAVAVVDAHHHLIDTHRLAYPWIEEPRPALTALLANYYDIAHDYDVQSYSADVDSERPAAAVACEFGARDGLAEARYVQRCADEWGWPSAFIAAVDLTSPKLDETLAAYQELPIVRAVRQPLYWASDPLRRLGAHPDFLSDAAWLRGFESVAATDLTWDLLVYDEQLPAAEELLRSFPSTRIVLEATGWPLDQSPDGYRGWEERLRSVAEHPQVTLKLQGLALIFGPTRSRVEPWVRTALSIFGARRCMFASHFPVDRLLWSWDEMLTVLEAVCDELPQGDRYEFFSGCARREYRLPA